MNSSNDIKIVGLASPKMASKTKWKIAGAIIGVVVLALSVVAGIALVRQNQNINEKAACVAKCPNSGGQLVNCSGTADTDGEVSLCNSAGRVEVCGQNASTSRQYCCPQAGGAWSTNLTLCAVSATATPTATAIATATATATTAPTSEPTATATATAVATSTGNATVKPTPTKTATSKATATVKATATATVTSTTAGIVTPVATDVPVPVTGASLPTILGTGFGILMVLISLGLAL